MSHILQKQFQFSMIRGTIQIGLFLSFLSNNFTWFRNYSLCW